MLRGGQQEFSHISIHSLASQQSNLTTAPPALGQSPGPAPESVSQATSPNPSSEGATALRENHQHHADSAVDRREDLSYTPAPGMNAQASDKANSSVSTPAARGTKRAHELDVEETDGDARRRRPGRRLTTREEIALFEICNQRADAFGRRSDICNWWRNVTEEFTHAYGRPYSWHSVRRKVEVVTKQRIKFLEGQRNHQEGDPPAASADGNVMNPEWCTVVDAWLPTWKRWGEAEIRRIERRDKAARRRSRGREQRPGPLSGQPIMFPLPQGGTTGSASTRPTSSASPVMEPGEREGERSAAGEASSTNQIQLPPGFENMFSNHKAWPPPARVPPSSSPPSSSSWQNTLSATNVRFSTLAATLGKLNKQLEATSKKGDPDPRTSPLISALLQATSEHDEQSRSPARETPQQQSNASVDVARLKEELRGEMQTEMRRELEHERAVFEEKIDSVQRTQEMILEMLRQEPS